MIHIISLLLVAGVCRSRQNVLKWGKQGHETVGFVGQKLLTPQGWRRVSKILNDSTDMAMANAGPWADQIKHKPGYHWTAPLHYIDLPDGACNFNYSRDCKSNICVAGAILNYTYQLQETEGELEQEAMKFLIHYAGDIHQPLHVGWTSDRGGNTIHGRYETHGHVNLHAVWDEYLIFTRIDRDFNKSWEIWGDYLAEQISTVWKPEQQEWTKCLSFGRVGGSRKQNFKNVWPCVSQWANESAHLACGDAYRDPNTGQLIPNDFDLEDDYYQAVIPVVERQIAKGSVRLAYILNTLYDVSFSGTSTV